MDNTERIGANGIFYADLLAAKVVEGVRDFPSVSDDEREAMLELVAARLTEAVAHKAVNHGG